MRFKVLAAAALIATGLACEASAAPYDRLYVFGDSLVDSGNAHRIDPVRAPTDRFTNGLNFADYLAQDLGLGSQATAYLNGGTNFAVGGATAAYYNGETSPDVGTQISGPPSVTPAAPAYPYNYATALAGGTVPAIDANSLVLLTAGGNDVRDYGSIGAPSPLQTVAAIQNALTTLIADGARNIVLVGLPDIGLIPEIYGTSSQAAATALSDALNAQYFALANGFNTQLTALGGHLTLYTLADLQRGIVANPAAYNLDPAKIHSDCVDGGALPQCQGYAYWDKIHPTDQVHQLIARAIVAELPEPSSWALMILGFGLTGATLRRRRTEAVPA